MHTLTIITSLAFLLFISRAEASLFDEVSLPNQDVEDLNNILALADIVDTGDINSDGIDDYIIKYKNSASNYGEFLFNTIISDGNSYRRGFVYDEYFIELSFKGRMIIGINREDATNNSVREYIYNVKEKSLKERLIKEIDDSSGGN